MLRRRNSTSAQAQDLPATSSTRIHIHEDNSTNHDANTQGQDFDNDNSTATEQNTSTIIAQTEQSRNVATGPIPPNERMILKMEENTVNFDIDFDQTLLRSTTFPRVVRNEKCQTDIGGVTAVSIGDTECPNCALQVHHLMQQLKATKHRNKVLLPFHTLSCTSFIMYSQRRSQTIKPFSLN